VQSSPLDVRGLGGALLIVNQVALGVTLLAVMVPAASLGGLAVPVDWSASSCAGVAPSAGNRHRAGGVAQ
jgi:hypothetical protein